jgi:hypothetical protein
MKQFFEIKIADDYKDLHHDLLKFTTMLVVLNLLMFLANPSENTFLGGNFVKFMIYILLGLVTYYLVVSKIIVFD